MSGFKGKREFEKFSKGEGLTRKEAMRAKCYECNGLEESRADCQVGTCPMYAGSTLKSNYMSNIHFLSIAYAKKGHCRRHCQKF